MQQGSQRIAGLKDFDFLSWLPRCAWKSDGAERGWAKRMVRKTPRNSWLIGKLRLTLIVNKDELSIALEGNMNGVQTCQFGCMRGRKRSESLTTRLLRALRFAEICRLIDSSPAQCQEFLWRWRQWRPFESSLFNTSIAQSYSSYATYDFIRLLICPLLCIHRLEVFDSRCRLLHNLSQRYVRLAPDVCRWKEHTHLNSLTWFEWFNLRMPSLIWKETAKKWAVAFSRRPFLAVCLFQASNDGYGSDVLLLQTSCLFRSCKGASVFIVSLKVILPISYRVP